jgi:hypothetical protein
MPASASALSRDTEHGYTLAILPWSDRDVTAMTVSADRVLHAAQIEEVTHAF